MTYRVLKEIKSISAAQGSWYRVYGPRKNPYLEKIALWAVITVQDRGPDNDVNSTSFEDIVIGMSASDVGVSGNDPEQWLTDVAGYIEVSDDNAARLVQDPELLSKYSLVWEEE